MASSALVSPYCCSHLSSSVFQKLESNSSDNYSNFRFSVIRGHTFPSSGRGQQGSQSRVSKFKGFLPERRVYSWKRSNCLGSEENQSSLPTMSPEKTPLLSSKTKNAENGDEENAENPPPSFDWKAVVFPFFFPAVGGMLFGYDIGATSGALVSLKDSVLSGTDWYNLSPAAVGLVVSGSLGGALAGSILAFGIADILGRRRELIVAAALYLVGAAAMAGAPSLSVLILGRFLFGLGIGLAMHAAPMYIAECSPSKIRGTLISLKEAFIVGGILLGYLTGNLWITTEGGWRSMYGVAIPLSVIMGGGMFFLPPSPRWLILRAGKCKENIERSLFLNRAEASLSSLRGSSYTVNMVKEEVEEMMSAQMEGEEERREKAEEGGGGLTSSFTELFQGANLQALVVGAGLVFFQQVTGQPSVLYYAASILQDAGFAAASDATQVAVLLGFFKLLMTGVAILTVDKVGRRPLLLIGVSGIILSLFSLGSFYALGGGNPLLSVGSLLLYVGAYQVSFGPISWLMVSEVFALPVRGRAQSLATLVNFGSNALVTFLLPPIQSSLGQAGTFFSFGIVGFVALGFVYFKVPETKGLSLEEIQEELVK